MPRQDRFPMLRLEALEIRTNPSSSSIEGIVSQEGAAADAGIVLVQPDDSAAVIDPTSATSSPDESGSEPGMDAGSEASADTSTKDGATSFETTIHDLSDPSSPPDDSPATSDTKDSGTDSSDSPTKSDPESEIPVVLAMTLRSEGATADSSESTEKTEAPSETAIFTITSQPAEESTGTTQDAASSQATDNQVKDESTQDSDPTVQVPTDDQVTTTSNGDDIDPRTYQTSVVPGLGAMTLSAAEVNRLASGFVVSQEFARNMVQAAFLKYLGRLAEQKGLDAWANAILSGQIDSTQMIILIASSQENLANAGYNVHKLFSDLYQNALGRDADALGLEDWVKAFFVSAGKKLGLGNDHIQALYQADKNGLSNQAFLTSATGLQTLRESVAGIFHSAEFRRYTVRSVYGGILDRDAAEKELQGWVQFLAAGHGQEDLIRQFVQSKEYQSHFRTPRAFVTGLYGDLLFRAPDAQGFLTMCGTFAANGQYHSAIDPELNQYYQELLVDAQTMNLPPYELLQSDLDEAYAIRLEGFQAQNLQFIADNNPGFSLGLLGSFLKAVAPAELVAGVDLSDGYQVYAFLRDHGDELSEELGTGSQTPTSSDFDLAKWMEAMPEQGEEMFAWLRSLYYQSIPERIAQYLPPADLVFDWTQFLPPGTIAGIAPGEPNGESSTDETRLAGSQHDGDDLPVT